MVLVFVLDLAVETTVYILVQFTDLCMITVFAAE